MTQTVKPAPPLSVEAERAAQAARRWFPGHTIAVFGRAKPYVVVYVDRTGRDPWFEMGWVGGVPVYVHKGGSINPLRPAGVS